MLPKFRDDGILCISVSLAEKQLYIMPYDVYVHRNIALFINIFKKTSLL